VSAGAGSADASFTTGLAPRTFTVPLPSRSFVVVALLFLGLSFQMVTFSGHLADLEQGSGPALKAYHGLFAAFGLLLVARGRLVKWRPEMILYFVVVGATALLASLRYGPQAAIVNTVFAAYAATIGASAGHLAGPGTTLRALRFASIVVLAAVLAKAWIFLPEIIRFFASPFGHPIIPTFFGGGPNLEATWVAMAGVFLIGSRLFIPYMAGSALICAAYASRSAFIVVALVVAASVAGTLFRGGASARKLLLPLAIAGISVGGVAVARGVDGADYIAQRFQSIGDDPGSTGRLTLWTGGAMVFQAHPFGVGLGNAVPQLERAIGASVTEDNLHNQYLQHLVETGVQGFIAYLLLVGFAVRRLFASRLRDPLLLYVGIYFLLAMLQFRGAEALLWFVYGLQHGTVTSLEETHAV
jgi:putative inorganic carbon (HCO3(-)) transporter